MRVGWMEVRYWILSCRGGFGDHFCFRRRKRGSDWALGMLHSVCEVLTCYHLAVRLGRIGLILRFRQPCYPSCQEAVQATNDRLVYLDCLHRRWCHPPQDIVFYIFSTLCLSLASAFCERQVCRNFNTAHALSLWQDTVIYSFDNVQ